MSDATTPTKNTMTKSSERMEDSTITEEESLPDLCALSKWEEACHRVVSHPHEASWHYVNRKRRRPSETSSAANANNSNNKTSPLALACRHGAPLKLVKLLLEAAPQQLRQCVPSYGTPLHEAVLHSHTTVELLQTLLDADQQQLLHGQRAALMQDVDGHTPLHLMIKRRFFSFGESSSSSTTTTTATTEEPLQMLQTLVTSCPRAVEIPDCGEYQEPPLVMALKSSLYSYNNEAGEMMELTIYKMVSILLQANGRAAGLVWKGARGPYTALHSAVFHGRCSNTIELLLRHTQDASACLLLANTQGELPLHFCAMRGEPPPSLQSLSHAAPAAVWKRDSSNLGAMHWLWIRFVSTLQNLQDTSSSSVSQQQRPLGIVRVEVPIPPRHDEYQTYTNWCLPDAADTQQEYFQHLKWIRKLDPPVDFLRMRHIPVEFLSTQQQQQQQRESDSETLPIHHWEERTAQILQHIRSRYFHPPTHWTRLEIVAALFWTKVVSLVQANFGSSPLLHAAMQSAYACPVSVLTIIAQLYPQEWRIADSCGKVPLHYACTSMNVPHDLLLLLEGGGHHDASTSTTTPPPLDLYYKSSGLCKENQDYNKGTLVVLELALQHCPREAARIADFNNRLPLHYAIDGLVVATLPKHNPEAICASLSKLVKLYPDSLTRRDGQTKLWPFLQAAAAAAACPQDSSTTSESNHNATNLSIVYTLLRENPTLISSRQNSTD